jgi:hypothetical protein
MEKLAISKESVEDPLEQMAELYPFHMPTLYRYARSLHGMLSQIPSIIHDLDVMNKLGEKMPNQLSVLRYTDSRVSGFL